MTGIILHQYGTSPFSEKVRIAFGIKQLAWQAVEIPVMMPKPDLNREIGAAVNALVDEGVVRPVVGARFPPELAAEALKLIDGRGATGKVVLEFR